mmetsp:Transcript_28794/g.78032  ORF Transcript_28794/g.78032 Transcript_28794/m.78032 type:complete len:251 (-) Transcript_28794:112-864(-)
MSPPSRPPPTPPTPQRRARRCVARPRTCSRRAPSARKARWRATHGCGGATGGHDHSQAASWTARAAVHTCGRRPRGVIFQNVIFSARCRWGGPAAARCALTGAPTRPCAKGELPPGGAPRAARGGAHRDTDPWGMSSRVPPSAARSPQPRGGTTASECSRRCIGSAPGYQHGHRCVTDRRTDACRSLNARDRRYARGQACPWSRVAHPLSCLRCVSSEGRKSRRAPVRGRGRKRCVCFAIPCSEQTYCVR